VVPRRARSRTALPSGAQRRGLHLELQGALAALWKHAHVDRFGLGERQRRHDTSLCEVGKYVELARETDVR
jgi:hypothetical protein